MSQLAARNISLRRGSRSILAGIDVAVAGGEMVGLIGPNGAGKTSLLRALACLLEIENGSVTLDGAALRTLEPSLRARRVAYVEQSGVAAWPISVADLVALGRLPYRRTIGRTSRADDEAVAAALQATGCSELAARAIDTLSSGERSRAMLARALAGQPDILLLDEPVAALDPAQQLAVMELLGRLAAQGTGVLAVLHDLPLASRFCHRLILMKEGRVLADGPAEAVLRDEFLAQAFSIVPARGSAEGRDYVLPWRRLQ